MNAHDFLTNGMIYLLAAVIAVPITQRLGLGSVLGYLLSGVLIGPSGLRLIGSGEDVLHFSEFGVLLLLFLIGLELNPRRLWQMRKPIFGMGGMQVASCITGITLAMIALGIRPGAAVVAAMGFAMSSTALALQLLRERNLHQIPAGEAAFSVLLFQDLAVIPMIAILPLFAASEATPQGFATGIEALVPIFKGILAILGVVLLGRYLVRPLFRVIASTGLRELFTAFSLLLIFGTAFLMQTVGLSMALGTFLAGVLLAESEYRHELEVDIEPFKGLLLGLFFIAVGMSMNLQLLFESPIRILAIVITLLATKAALLFGLARFFKYNNEEASIFSLGLSQGGEFAFVLFGVAGRLGILSSSETGSFNIAVVLSMTATPFLFMLYERTIRPRLGDDGAETKRKYAVQDERNPVILAGFGRIGQVIGRLFHARGIGLTVLEQDPAQIEVMRKFGWKTFYGDVSRLDLLQAAGAKEAKLLILCIDDMEAAQRTIDLVKEHFPHLKILVRAESRIDAYHFHNQGVRSTRVTFAPGLEMAQEALHLLGYPKYEARVIGERFRRYDLEQFVKTASVLSDEKAFVNIVQQSREELARIMVNDDRRRGEIVDDAWG